MFGYEDVKTLSFCISDPGADLTIPLVKISSRHSKIEILEAWAIADTAVTHNNGTGIALTLLDYGTTGTVNTGTVSSVLGGTTVSWTASVPKAFTISEGTFTGGRYLALKYDETGAIAIKNLIVGFSYVVGVGA